MPKRDIVKQIEGMRREADRLDALVIEAQARATDAHHKLDAVKAALEADLPAAGRKPRLRTRRTTPPLTEPEPASVASN